MSVSTTVGPTVRPASGDPDREAAGIERVTARLVKEHAGPVEPARVRREVERAVDELKDATVRNYVPLLVERRVRRLLRDATPMLDHEGPVRSAVEPRSRSTGPPPGRPTTRAKEAS